MTKFNLSEKKEITRKYPIEDGEDIYCFHEEDIKEIIIGFVLELNRQDVDGRIIGERLAKLTEIFGEWDK